MDAKPQRPLRTLRVYGDENALPATGVQKTIHQRNKSSPSLSTMLQNGTSKAPAKRTAFGDVSNTANVARPSKDDLILNVKSNLKIPDKITMLPNELKPSAFQRPAQRPLSVSGLKSLLSNVTNATKEVKRPLEDSQPIIQPTTQLTNTRNVTTKKSTAVFKDLAPSQVVPPVADMQKPLPSTAQTAPVAPVHRELPARHNSTKSQDVKEPRLRRAPSKYIDASEVRPVACSHSHTIEQPLSEEAPALRSDGVYIDGNGAIQVYEFDDVLENLEETVELAGVPVPVQPKQVNGLGQADLDRLLGAQLVEAVPEAVQKSTLPPVSEPEEYWDQDAVDNYDEEGYVTARSFKSRTDNTTGNATTVLFPKVTQRVKNEIFAAKELIEGSKTVEELEDEAWDTTMVAEYGDEIFGYMKELEIKMLPNAHYMDNQAEIQWSMRAVLMDWIVQVHHRFNLLPETLFLCVNYIDRFLSCKVVSLGKLQLVGATAIFIAAKYEEIDCPSIQEIVYMVDGGYNAEEILKAERFMLSMLQFELGWPGPMSFLRRISKADDYDLETRTLAKYFLEITIMDERFVGSPPSFVAAGAHCLARMMLRKGSWSPAHVYYSNYTYSQLFSLVLLMVECCEDARKHHCAVFDKYTDKRYKRASQFAECEMQKGFQVLEVISSTTAHKVSPHLAAAPFGNAYDNRLLWDPK